MKGPRSRHKFNVQRIWECPQCKTRVFAPPQVVTLSCGCNGPQHPTWMCLIEQKPTRVRKPDETDDASPMETPP